MNSMTGKVAIVTGASRGIGEHIASRFAAAGAKVVVAARSTEASPGRLAGTVEETVGKIRGSGGDAIAVAADLAKAGDRERIVAAAIDTYGQVDILVNNAAIVYFAPASEFDLARMRLMFEIQVFAAVHLAQLVLPGMRVRGQGWICNITSDVAGHPRVPPSRHGATGTTTVYGMCKAALERFTSGLAAEVHHSGVVVSALGPSRVVPTPGTVFHGVTSENDPNSEGPEVMAEAAYLLCTAPDVNGRITHSQDLLTGLGIPIPTASSHLRGNDHD
jgi:NAD(P)-dependent dehydrogenase (short-subunit alcohol dehydrogenase family)